MAPKVLPFLRPFYRLMVLSFVLNLILSIASTVSVMMINPVFTTISSDPAGTATPVPGGMNVGGFAPKQWLDSMIRAVIISPDFMTSIRNLSVALFFVFLIRGIAKYLGNVISTRIEEGVMKSIRDTLFTKISGLSMEYFGRKKSGEIISLLTNDVGVVNHSTIHAVTTLWRESTSLIITLALLLVISAKLTGIAFVVSIGGLFIIRFFTEYLRRYGRRMQKAQADFTTTLQESVLGVRVVKGMGLEPYVVRTFVSQTADYVRSALRNTRVTALIPVVNDTFGIAALVCVFFAGGLAMSSGEISGSELLTFLFLLFSLMQPISVITGTIATMQRGFVSAEHVVETLEEQPAIVTGHVHAPALRSEIQVRNLTFAYGEKPVLRDVSFTIHRGETVAFVGSSGSGKSTMLDMLLRFYDPQHGNITIDGTDIQSFELGSYRRLYGTVAQETILFNDSIGNNISLGDTSADQARIEKAATIAHANGFVQTLPDRYDTNVGDRGMKLSGGQRQRIAIARALYREPEVLLFDEATSALDTESERIVQEAINDILKDRTAVVVAHRLSTIVNADRIFVFDEGRIVESGSHTELLRAGGVYRNLYDMQFAGTRDEA